MNGPIKRSIVGRELTLSPDILGERPSRIVYLSPPHAPSMVTTISPNGTVNVGSFEQTMLCSNVPAVMILAISPKSDTLHNLLDTGECVINFPYPEYVQQVYDAGVRLPRGESEMPYLTGFTTAPSIHVKPPRLEQCWWAGEGLLRWTQESGDHTACGVEIVSLVVDEDVWKDDIVERRTGLPVLYYATSGHFFEPGAWTVVEESERVRNAGHSG